MSLRLGVLGDPIGHSLSPQMHSAALESADLTGSYVRRQCDESGFRLLIEELRRGEWDGFNVTMPHKVLAFEMCDFTTSVAGIARSVNTLKMTGETMQGHSSDVVAFQGLFSSSDFESAPILVLGSGGSAAAALACATAAVFDRAVYVTSRNRESLSHLIDRFDGLPIEMIPYGSVVAGAIVVNATPLGMHGEGLPTGVLDVAAGLIDLPYGPNPTRAVAEAQASSIPVCDGYRFLALQAAESFLWWTGHAADVELMETAARNG